MPWLCPCAASVSGDFRFSTLPLLPALASTDIALALSPNSPLNPFANDGGVDSVVAWFAFDADSGGSEAVDNAAVIDAAGGSTVTFFDLGFFGGGLQRMSERADRAPAAPRVRTERRLAERGNRYALVCH